MQSTVSNGNGVLADAHLLPVSHIGYTNGRHVLAYIRSTKKQMHLGVLDPLMFFVESCRKEVEFSEKTFLSSSLGHLMVYFAQICGVKTNWSEGVKYALMHRIHAYMLSLTLML